MTQLNARQETLDDALWGRLVLPWDDGWDEARRAWNLALDQQPDAVVYPETVDDVIAVVDFAREHGLRVAAQATGHGAAARGPLSGALLLNTARMRRFELKADARTVRVEAGTRWGPVADAASRVGLAPLGGSRDIGVVGYMVGGGLSWLGRRYGLGANSVRAIELVTADGEHRRVNHDNDADLFWALRGGGGSFGVVTAMELELFNAPELYAGRLVWPIEAARDVIDFYAGWSEDAPEELSASLRLLHLPDHESVPRPLRGRSWVVVYAAFLGDTVGGAAEIAPLRALRPLIDTVAPAPASALAELHADPPGPVASRADSLLLDDLAPEAVDDLVGLVGTRSRSRLTMVQLRQLGGALQRPRLGHGALSVLPGRYLLIALGTPLDPNHARAVDREIRAVLDAFQPEACGRVFLNAKERPGDASGAFAPETYRRLAEIKARYDPENVFLANHPIDLAT
jgi:FAD/FMN-containing dehydrogenase